MTSALWLPAVRLLRRVTAAMILLGSWQVAVDLWVGQ